MKKTLRFNQNGKFKIMMFSDLQDKLPIHESSLKMLDTLIETEKPDFVIAAGDQCNGDVESLDEFRSYVEKMSKPMESRSICWSHVFGNHDDEFIKSPDCVKENQQKIYEEFPHCLSDRGPADIGGVGNYVLPVKASSSEDIKFNIWGLDSNKYIWDNKWIKGEAALPNNIMGPCGYDFIKFPQIMWYYNTSVEMEKECGHKIPGLMVFHIALPEHKLVPMNPKETGMQGTKNEDECNAPIDSGLFAAALQRGDIKGIFVGHDHINDYVGSYLGIMLGFDGSAGYGNYGFNSDDEKERNKLRGARFFEIEESHPEDMKTWMRYGHEFNIF